MQGLHDLTRSSWSLASHLPACCFVVRDPSACFKGLLAGLFRLPAGSWAAAGQGPTPGCCAAADADWVPSVAEVLLMFGLQGRPVTGTSRMLQMLMGCIFNGMGP